MLYADRVRETTTSTGTGNLTLAGAATGFITFNTAFGVGSSLQFEYVISSPGGSEWEVGVGHLSASTTLVRDTIRASSNSGSAVNFSAGTKDVRGNLAAYSVTNGLGRLLGAPQVFTSGSGATYTPTAGTREVIVEGWAGGGGATGAPTPGATAISAGAGGGSGGYFKKRYTGITTGTYTVGTAGSGGSTAGGAGGDGNDTTFTDGTTLCTAKGGKGATALVNNQTANGVAVGGAGGAISTNGDVNMAGWPGTNAQGTGAGSAGRGYSGNGGGPGGGVGLGVSGNGNDGTSRGAGGSGGLALGAVVTTNRTGGAGFRGEIIVWEYS